MFTNLLSEFFGAAKKLVSSIIILFLLSYGFGFVLINTYIATYNINSFDITNSAIFSAGLFFISLESWAALTVLPFVAIGSRLIVTTNAQRKRDFLRWKTWRKYLKKMNNSGNGLDYFLVKVYHLIRLFFYPFITLLILFLSIWFLFSRVIDFSNSWLAKVLDYSTLNDLNITQQTKPIIGIFGAFFSCFILAFRHWKDLSRLTQSFVIASIGIFFIFVHFFSLIWIGSRVYEKVPTILGGGEPQKATLVFNCSDVEYLNTLRIPLFFQDKENCKADEKGYVRTCPMKILWQLDKSAEESDNTGSAFMYILDSQENTLAVLRQKIYAITPLSGDNLSNSNKNPLECSNYE